MMLVWVIFASVNLQPHFPAGRRKELKSLPNSTVRIYININRPTCAEYISFLGKKEKFYISARPRILKIGLRATCQRQSLTLEDRLYPKCLRKRKKLNSSSQT